MGNRACFATYGCALVGLVAVSAVAVAGEVVASAAAGGSTPCVVEIEVAADEVAPSTTLPGTCAISAASGTIAPRITVASTIGPPALTPARAHHVVDTLQAIYRAARRALFLAADRGVGPAGRG